MQRVLRASGTEAIITTTQVPLSVKTGQEGGKIAFCSQSSQRPPQCSALCRTVKGKEKGICTQ